MRPIIAHDYHAYWDFMNRKSINESNAKCLPYWLIGFTCKPSVYRSSYGGTHEVHIAHNQWRELLTQMFVELSIS